MTRNSPVVSSEISRLTLDELYSLHSICHQEDHVTNPQMSMLKRCTYSGYYTSVQSSNNVQRQNLSTLGYVDIRNLNSV
jgi:hypothetical protein